MSVLDCPRLVFSGEISWDPIVTNNSPTNYDETTAENLPLGESAKKYRAAAIDQVTSGGNWNPHGTHRSVFFDTFVSGAELEDGPSEDDKVLGVPVSFSGMLVDLEPYGVTSSQLFFDEMSFGIPGGCQVAGRRATRFTDRYINFGRNPSVQMIAGGAGITWQTCFPADHLQLHAHDSLVIQGLSKALKEEDVLGLMVRWHAFRTVYFNDLDLSNGSAEAKAAEKLLQDKLKKGGWQPNPARSLLVGSLGIWRRDDPIHEPGDRALIPAGAKLSDGADFGPSFAKVGSGRITVDLGSFVPEKNHEADKHDVGDLSLVAVNAGKTVSLGTIAYGSYDKTAYGKNAGILSLDLTVDQVAAANDGKLQILDSCGVLLGNEETLRAISSDPNLYLDEGTSAESQVRIYQKGIPAGAGVEVQLVAFSGCSSKPVGQPKKTDADGVVRFKFAAQAAGVVQYGFGFPPASAPTQLTTTSVTYMSVRVLPADEDIAALPATWENVYGKVLENWYAMAPCMDNWLLLNDPEMVKRYGPIVKRLTGEDNFESFLYMPVTRDLSAGKRRLLYRYLDGQPDAPNDSEANLIKVSPWRHGRPENVPSRSDFSSS